MSAPARRIDVSDSRIARVAVDPAVGGGGLDHRVLAGHLVGGDGHVRRRGAHVGDDVEVGHRRLDHDDVGALGEVEQRPRAAPRAGWPGPAGRCGGRPAAGSRRPRGTGRRTPTRTWRRRRGSRRRRGRRRRARARTTPTWPSIIPLVPTTWAPAAACATRHLGVELAASRRCRPSRRASSTPQWPWSVNSSRHRSAMTSGRRRPRRATSPIVTLRMPSGSAAPEPAASCARGRRTA